MSSVSRSPGSASASPPRLVVLDCASYIVRLIMVRLARLIRRLRRVRLLRRRNRRLMLGLRVRMRLRLLLRLLITSACRFIVRSICVGLPRSKDVAVGEQPRAGGHARRLTHVGQRRPPTGPGAKDALGSVTKAAEATMVAEGPVGNNARALSVA